MQYIFGMLEKSSHVSDYIENQPYNNNVNEEDLKLITNIANNDDIVINTGDKNLGFSINHIK